MKIQIPEGDFEGYIFDLDGTLVDTMPLHYTAWEAALRKAGLKGSLDENLFYELGGVPSKKVAALLGKHHGLSLDPEAVYKDKEEVFKSSLQKLAVIAPVVEFARRVSKTRPVAIASGGTRDVVEGRGHRRRCGARETRARHVPFGGEEDGRAPVQVPRVRGRQARCQGGRGRRDEVGLCPEPWTRVGAPRARRGQA